MQLLDGDEVKQAEQNARQDDGPGAGHRTLEGSHQESAEEKLFAHRRHDGQRADHEHRARRRGSCPTSCRAASSVAASNDHELPAIEQDERLMREGPQRKPEHSRPHEHKRRAPAATESR